MKYKRRHPGEGLILLLMLVTLAVMFLIILLTSGEKTDPDIFMYTAIGAAVISLLLGIYIHWALSRILTCAAMRKFENTVDLIALIVTGIPLLGIAVYAAGIPLGWW